ncbi:MAG: 2-oxoacid:ferredoxin oxidoreductase subunit gamma, partial [Acidobacteria bacterium]
QVIMAGFGGQGVMLIGKILAHAGMNDGKEVSWLPSYGPEMRGGTSNCTVVVSDEPVGSPLVYAPSAVIAMNEPSLAKFEPRVKPGGLLLVNSCLVRSEVGRRDIHTLRIPANDVAAAVGNPRAANMAALGAYVAATGVTSLDTVEAVIRKMLSNRPATVESNLEALRRGHRLALQALAAEAA